MTTLLSIGGLAKDFTLEDQIIFAKNAEFDGVDYIATITDLFFPPNNVLHLAKKHNIKIKAVHIPLPFVIYTPNFLQKRVIQNLFFFPDSKVFNFHLSGFIHLLQRTGDNMRKFQKIAKENNITLSCESNPNEYFILKYYPKETYDPDAFAKFCIKNNVPINLDTSHIASWNYDVVTFFTKYYKYINLIHLSDMTPQKQHLPLGKGALPLGKLFEEIQKVSYKGTVVFEIFNFPKGTSKEEIQKEITKSLEIFKKSDILS